MLKGSKQYMYIQHMIHTFLGTYTEGTQVHTKILKSTLLFTNGMCSNTTRQHLQSIAALTRNKSFLLTCTVFQFVFTLLALIVEDFDCVVLSPFFPTRTNIKYSTTPPPAISNSNTNPTISMTTPLLSATNGSR